MRRAGLAEQNLKTVGVSLVPIREFDPKNGRERLRGYRASNRIQLTIVDPGKTGAVIDSAVAAGANDVAEIAYYLDDPGILRAKALASALCDARRRADSLASAAGLRVRAAISLSEQAVDNPRPMDMMFQAAKRDGGNTTPVAPGQYSIQAHVRARFSAR